MSKKKQKKYTINMIDDYQNRLTDEQKEKVIKHRNKYNVTPIICAWYEDINDFTDKWSQYGYSKTEARQKLIMSENQGEFKKFADDTIIRFSI